MQELGQVEGRNAVMELINSNKDINKIFVQTGERHGSITKIIAKAKANRSCSCRYTKKDIR